MTSSQALRVSKLKKRSDQRQEEKETKLRYSPSEAYTTTIAILVAQDPGRSHLVRCEKLAELVLIHRLREVRDVEVRVALVREGLELGIERFPRKADFVAQVVKAADAILGVFVVVVLDKAKTVEWSAMDIKRRMG